MTREEKKAEIRIIRAHIITVMEDCLRYRNRLEGIGCRAEAKRLESVANKLCDMSLKMRGKANK